MLQMAKDLGRQMDAMMLVDSSAAFGVMSRKGCGKLHMHIGHLWIQEAAENKDLVFEKVGTQDNPADLCTKNLSKQDVDKRMETTPHNSYENRANQDLQFTVSRAGRY